MKSNSLPLKVLSINEIYNGDKLTYEVPIYQRNYAWEKDEIATLIQDVYDAFKVNKEYYYIGTLVSFHKGDQVYEVIDGQQRLTTINLVLSALNIKKENKLTYRARKKSNDTIQSIPQFNVDETDSGIVNGYRYASEAISDKISNEEHQGYKDYFLHNVQIVHYQVPKDLDLNHYFEIMNSRGEQLEKHEIIKARLIKELTNKDKAKFHRLWEFCSEMNVYIQQKYRDLNIFGRNHSDLRISNFDELPDVDDSHGYTTIKSLLTEKELSHKPAKNEKPDTFLPIIDFSNFLLIVLKLTLINKKGFIPKDYTLDDKELIREFDKVKNDIDRKFVKTFAYNLLKAKYLLDNYIVHHSNDEDTIDSNPWKLQKWIKDGKNEYLVNLTEDLDLQDKLVHMLSMFEVSFTARQRKNYLFYCLFHLFEDRNTNKYFKFLSGLAEKYLKDVYMVAQKLNQINTPNPGSFDETILIDNQLNISAENKSLDFIGIYGNGSEETKGIPLFIFNYLDYKLWLKYVKELRGEKTRESSKIRKDFFSNIGCSDFGLKVFEQFYFSRTRRSLEHYYPQAWATGKNGRLNQDQINCLGNFAMIGSAANTSGSNWSPKSKLDHYLDASGKINQVSVASIKFMIMMQICKENQDIRDHGEEWNFQDILAHQIKMTDILLN
jgi:hypothetical protein